MTDTATEVSSIRLSMKWFCKVFATEMARLYESDMLWDTAFFDLAPYELRVSCMVAIFVHPDSCKLHSDIVVTQTMARFR
jgi:hypothetical protein